MYKFCELKLSEKIQFIFVDRSYLEKNCKEIIWRYQNILPITGIRNFHKIVPLIGMTPTVKGYLLSSRDTQFTERRILKIRSNKKRAVRGKGKFPTRGKGRGRVNRREVEESSFLT